MAFSLAFIALLIERLVGYPQWLVDRIGHPVIWIGNLVFCILAGVAANKGENYRYPVTLRLIS